MCSTYNFFPGNFYRGDTSHSIKRAARIFPPGSIQGTKIRNIKVYDCDKKKYPGHSSQNSLTYPWLTHIQRFSLTFYRIPWLFPDLEKLKFSLTFPWPLATLNWVVSARTLYSLPFSLFSISFKITLSVGFILIIFPSVLVLYSLYSVDHDEKSGTLFIHI